MVSFPDFFTVTAPDGQSVRYVPEAQPPAPGLAPLVFAQQDPRWKNDLMGGVYQTVGGYGCAMVCACMVYSQIDPTITPGDFNATLNAEGGYNIVNGNEAHLAWDRLPAIFPHLQWLGRESWTRLLTGDELAMVRAKIDAHPLVLWVDFRPNVYGMQSHFVLAVENTPDDVTILDPWEGVEVGLLARYGRSNDTLERAVWGYREIVAG